MVRHKPSVDSVDLVTIRLLLALEAHGSIGQAAAAMHMTQPSASERLARFEELVGLRLVERTPAGSHLTRAGLLVAEWGGRVGFAVEGMVAAIGSLEEGGGTPLRVAASLTIAEYFLPTWLAALSERLPSSNVHLEVGNSAEVCARLLDHQADLGFIESPHFPASLQQSVFATDEIIAVVGRTHRWADDPVSRTPRTLDGEPLIVRERGSGTRAIAEGAVGELSDRDGVIEVQSAVAARAAIAMGRGVAILSALSVQDDIAAHRMVPVSVEGFPVARSLRAVWRSATSDDPLAAALRAIAHEQSRPTASS